MARVRLTALGYEKFTGNIGKVRFTDGVSANITPKQAEVVGAAYASVLVAANGTTVLGSASPAARVAATQPTRAGQAPSIDAPAHQLRLDLEPFYAKTITAETHTLTAGDAGYLLDFSAGAVVTVPEGLPAGFYCTLRQGGDDQIAITGADGVTVEEIDNRLKSEKRLAILHLARFDDGSYQLTGRTAE